MLCCAGLLAGLFVGQYLGGIWVIAAPALGFGLGLIGDVKFQRLFTRARPITSVPQPASGPLRAIQNSF